MNYNADDFTRDKVAQALRDAVASKPEGYVYPRQPKAMPEGENPNLPFYPNTPHPWGAGCFYVHTEESGEQVPGCIVGTVLHSLGVPLAEFRAAEGKNVSGLREVLDLPLERDTWRMLGEAQYEQDCGQTWAQAAEYALSR